MIPSTLAQFILICIYSQLLFQTVNFFFQFFIFPYQIQFPRIGAHHGYNSLQFFSFLSFLFQLFLQTGEFIKIHMSFFFSVGGGWSLEDGLFNSVCELQSRRSFVPG